MARITWADKIALIITGLPHVNVWKDADANELKNASDNHDERLDDLEQGLINEVVNVSAIWTGTGLNYNVTAENFGGSEGGKAGYFSAPADTVTLTVADGADERIDRIGVFYPVAPATDGIVGKIDGIPGSGIAEDYDPTLFFHIRFATVEALATSPKDTSRETVYLEDAGEPAEWVASDNTANIVQDSTNDPDVGTVSIEGTNVVKGNINIFTHSSTFSTSDFDLLTYRTKLKNNFDNSSWNIKFFNSTTQIGRTYRFKDNQNNFDSSNISTYQSIRIDFAKLNLPVADFDIFQIYPEKAFTGYFIDEVYLHKGSGNGNIVQGVEEAPIDDNLYARINKAWQAITLGVGDMILANVQIVTGAKTFNDGKLLMRNVADTFSSVFTNVNTAIRTYILQNKSGIIAHLSDTAKIYNVKDFGALGDGIDLLDGAITIGTPNFTSITSVFTAADVTKVIAIEGAGASGGYLVTSILAYVGGGAVTLADNAVATVSGSNFYYGTDDTDAIQDTINAAFAAGGGKVYIPRGIYIINGPLLNNVGVDLIDYNSQIWIPGNDVFDAERTTIEIHGEFMPNAAQSGGIAGPITVATGSCLRSTIQGSGTYPSVIASEGAAGWTRTANFTSALFKDLNIQVTVDGNDKVTMGGINCLGSSVARCKRVMCFPYAVDFSVNSGEPNVLDVIGIAMPENGGEHIQTSTACYVGGFTYGYVVGDHGNLHESSAICCTTGIAFRDAGQTCGATKLVIHWCKYDIGVIRTVTDSRIFMQHVQVEISDAVGKWYDHVATINDPSHYLIGKIDYLAQFPYDGDDYVKIGGQNLQVELMINSDPVVQITGTSYTPVMLDAFRFSETTNAASVTITVPPFTDVNFDHGAVIEGMQGGTGQNIFVGGVGVTVESAEELKSRAEGSAWALKKLADNRWLLTGDIELTP